MHSHASLARSMMGFPCPRTSFNPSILRTSSTPDSMVNSPAVLQFVGATGRFTVLKVSISSTWFGSNDFFLIYSDKHAK